MQIRSVCRVRKAVLSCLAAGPIRRPLGVLDSWDSVSPGPKEPGARKGGPVSGLAKTSPELFTSEVEPKTVSMSVQYRWWMGTKLQTRADDNTVDMARRPVYRYLLKVGTMIMIVAPWSNTFCPRSLAKRIRKHVHFHAWTDQETSERYLLSVCSSALIASQRVCREDDAVQHTSILPACLVAQNISSVQLATSALGMESCNVPS